MFFYKKGDEWDYLLLDALPIQAYPTVFEKTIDACIKINQGITLTKKDRENLKRGINYVRIINGISLSLGLSDRLELPNGFSVEGLLELIKG